MRSPARWPCSEGAFGPTAEADAEFDVEADTAPDAEADTAPDVEADTAPDAEADTAPDAEADTALDTTPDAEADTAPDTALDTTPDVALDTTPDSAPDTTPDAAPDTTPDAALDTTPDAAPDTTPDAAPDTAPDAALDTTPDAAPDTTPDTAPDADAGTTVRGRVSGRVTRALSGRTEPLGGVRVWAGDVETVTDADGFYVLDDVIGPEAMVEVAPASPDEPLSSSLRAVVFDDGDEVFVPFELLDGCAGELDLSAADATLTFDRCAGDRGAQLTLPFGSARRSDDGTPVTRVNAVLVPLPVGPRGLTESTALTAFPGDMTALAADGSSVWLDSRGAIEVRLTDADTGSAVELADGATARIAFPADPRWASDTDARVPAWWFDTASGTWIEDESATSTVEVDPATGQLMHRFEVSHFTWWNADRAAERTCVTGTALDADGNPAGPAAVVSLGVDYIGSAAAATDESGRFEVFARAGSIVDVVLMVPDGSRVLEDRRRVITGPSDGACVDAGALRVDRAEGLTCARGRVVDAAGLPVDGATVNAWSPGRWVEVLTGSDGSYCVPVEPGVLFDLTVEMPLGSGWLAGRLTDRVVAGDAPAVCTEGGADGCSDLPDITAAASGCVRGRVIGEFGGIESASVVVSSPAGARSALSDSDGAYCVPVDSAERQTIVAIARRADFVGSRVTTQIDGLEIFSAGSTCDAPDACDTIDLFVDDVACTAGQLVDAAGDPIVGARLVVSVDGGAPLDVTTTGSDGRFCATGPTGAALNLSFSRYADGVRSSADARINNGLEPGACGVTACADAGVIVADDILAGGCVTGRLNFGPESITSEVLLDVDGSTFSVVPDRSGTFCAEVPPALDAILRRSYETECLIPAEISVDLGPLVAGDCRDVAGCLDVGELDFEDFCAAS